MRATIDGVKAAKRLRTQTTLQAFTTAEGELGAGTLITGITPQELRRVRDELTYIPKDFPGVSLRAPINAFVEKEVGGIVTLRVPRVFGWRRWRCNDGTATGRPLPPGSAFLGALKGGDAKDPPQQEAAASTLKVLQREPYSCMLVLPCGFGKTVTALSIVCALGKRALVLVHTKALVAQWCERGRQFLGGLKIEAVEPKRLALASDIDIVVCTVQAVATAKEVDYSDFGTLILDEAHHMAARWFSTVFFRLSIRYVIGLTATPKRKDGCTPLLELYMGEPAYSLTRADLDGSSVNVSLIRYDDFSRREIVDQNGDPLIHVMKTQLSKDRRRNRSLGDLVAHAASLGRRVIVLSDRISQLEEIHSIVQSEGTSSVSLFVGSMKKAERTSALEKRTLLATYQMASEGLDIPELDTVVFATPISDVQQAIGRITRSHPDKQSALVIDVVDPFSVFQRQANARQSFYNKCGYKVVARSFSDALDIHA